MTRYLISAIVLLIYQSGFTQDKWVSKDLDSIITIQLPENTVYSVKDELGTYTSTTSSCIFFTTVQCSTNPNYAEFIKLPQEKQDDLIEELLDKTMNGAVMRSGNENIPSGKIHVGKYSGREAAWNTQNPVKGGSSYKFTQILYTPNKLYYFQCMYLKGDAKSQTEKNRYFESIKTW